MLNIPTEDHHEDSFRNCANEAPTGFIPLDPILFAYGAGVRKHPLSEREAYPVLTLIGGVLDRIPFEPKQL